MSEGVREGGREGGNQRYKKRRREMGWREGGGQNTKSQVVRKVERQSMRQAGS